MVWRWQQRFAEEGIEGLLRDKTRPPGIPPVPQAKVHAVVERTLREPPGAVTHWTGRAITRSIWVQGDDDRDNCIPVRTALDQGVRLVEFLEAMIDHGDGLTNFLNN